MTCCELQLSKGTFHCALCCVTFGTIELFDHHQAYDPGARKTYCTPLSKMLTYGYCQDRWGVVRTTADAAAVEAKVDAMHAARAK